MSNGLESRLVENANKVGYKFKSSDGIQTIATGDIINIDPLANTGSAPGIPFASYERIGSAFTANLAGLGFGDELNWMLVDTTPQNSPITLDSSNSSAYKHLMTIGKDSDGMAHLQVFSQEMIWDYDVDSTQDIDFVNWTSASTASRASGTYIHLTDGEHEGYWYVNRTDSLALSNDNWVNIDGKVYYNAKADGLEYLTRWDGNGFGDDNEFTQLTNGTLTDDNANTIITKVSSIPLNTYLGDE